jgi:hypothetical protein
LRLAQPGWRLKKSVKNVGNDAGFGGGTDRFGRSRRFVASSDYSDWFDVVGMNEDPVSGSNYLTKGHYTVCFVRSEISEHCFLLVSVKVSVLWLAPNASAESWYSWCLHGVYLRRDGQEVKGFFAVCERTLR